MFVFVAKDAWAELISHKGDLNVEVAIAWCSIAAYPLWSSGTLEGSEAEGWAQIFILIGIPILFTPWKYVFNTFVLGKD